jgi:3-deoxy-manno-octulosonate cytidylyltransferase (CMP-KDO synthetase)
VQLPQSAREKEEKLEQLRALDNQMRIEIGLIDFLPLGVDTPEDLEKMQKLI